MTVHGLGGARRQRPHYPDLDEGPHHHEEPHEKHEGRPLDVGDGIGDVQVGDGQQGSRTQQGDQRWLEAGQRVADEPDEDAGQDEPRLGEEPGVGDVLSFVEVINASTRPGGRWTPGGT